MVAPRIYPSLPGSTPFYCDHVKCIRLPESTPPSQNIPPFSTTIGDPPRIYPSQNIPPFQQMYVRPYSPRIYPPPPSENIPFSTTIILCDPPRIYPLPESTPFSTNLCVRQQLYATLPEYTPSPRIYPLFNNCMRPSQNLPLPPRI